MIVRERTIVGPCLEQRDGVAAGFSQHARADRTGRTRADDDSTGPAGQCLKSAHTKITSTPHLLTSAMIALGASLSVIKMSNVFSSQIRAKAVLPSLLESVTAIRRRLLANAARLIAASSMLYSVAPDS